MSGILIAMFDYRDREMNSDIDIEADEDEYPQEATIGDQWLREPWRPYKQTLRRRATMTSTEIQRRIAELAYQLFVRQGRRHGHDLDHWLEAEELIRAHLTSGETQTGERADGEETQ